MPLHALTPPLALTMGDPAGIGPDIALIAWLQTRLLAGASRFFLLACPATMRARAKALGLDVPITEIANPSETPGLFPRSLPILPIPCPDTVTIGISDPRNAPAILAAIETGVRMVQCGAAAALVTNPIAKQSLQAAGFPHPGHTEFLAELAARYWGGPVPRPVMMLASEDLRVIPLTIHVPLARVPSLITRPLILETVRITARALVKDFGITNPRIAVCGLNPHAGEGGMLGAEENETISPAIAELAREGFSISGPHSADTLFHAAARIRYDAAVTMYHDQALIPLKTLAFDEGVNVTLGLPFVRTSPDHGTAFDIAGSGKASPTSLLAALKLAERLASRRAPAPSAP